MNNRFLALGVPLLLLVACSKPASDEIGFGHFEENRYINEYFNFQITLPETWDIQEQETLNAMTKTGAEMIAGNNKNLQSAVRAAELQTVNLFAVFKFPAGSPVDSNPNLICVAERLNLTPGIKTGKDYLFHVKKFITAGNVEISFPKEVYSIDLSGEKFHILEAEMDLGVAKIQQMYCSTVLKDYALGMVLTYTNDSEKAELMKILDTVVLSQDSSTS